MLNPIQEIREDLAFYKRVKAAEKNIAENPIILWWKDQDFRHELLPAITSHTLPLYVPMEDEEVLVAIIQLADFASGGSGSGLMVADEVEKLQYKPLVIIFPLMIGIPLLILALAAYISGSGSLAELILFASLYLAVFLPLGLIISVGIFLDKLKMIPEIVASVLFFGFLIINYMMSNFFDSLSYDATPLHQIGIMLAGLAVSTVIFFLVSLYGAIKIRRLIREKRLKTT